MKHLIYIGVILSIIGCTTTMNSMMGFNYYVPDPKVTTEYDKFEQYWDITTSENAVLRKSDSALSVNSSALMTCKSKAECSPEVIIQFISVAPDWTFLKYRRLIFLIDGKRFVYEPSHDGKVISGSKLIEQMFIHMPFSLFKSMAFSNNVEARLGNHELDLSYEQRSTYRLLVNEVEGEIK